MKPFHLLSASLLSAALMLSTDVLASHKTNETYDGTIYSFRWLKTPIDLSRLAFSRKTGEPTTLSQFKGKVVLINLWASWCKPCIKELPALDRLQKRLGGKDFEVVAISLDKEIPDAEKIFTDLSIESLAFFHASSDRMAQQVPVDVIPVNIFVNAKNQATGILRSSFNWDAEASDGLIKRLISGVSSQTLRMEMQQHKLQTK